MTTQAKKSILIVDDSEDMRDLLAQILEEEETYQLLFAENAEQALAEVKRFQPDLILMDMSLPGTSGWEIVPQLRLLPGFTHTPIIAVTAHVSLEDQERTLAVGCNYHLGKPFDVTEVLDVITHLLNTSSNQSAEQ